MRRLRSALLLSIAGLAITAAGCGSDASAVPEVPGPPAALSVPHQRSLAAAASATPTPTATAGATATPAAGTGTTGSTGATGTTGSTGTGATTGAAATPAPTSQNNTASTQAPATGSPPQKFEQFCQENAGAC